MFFFRVLCLVWLLSAAQPSLLPDHAMAQSREEISQEFDKINAALISRDKAFFRTNPLTQTMKDNVDATLDKAFAELPPGVPVETHLGSLSWKSFSSLTKDKSYTDWEAVYQHQFTEGWAVVSIRLRTEDGNTQMTRLLISRVPNDLRVVHAFTLHGKPVWRLLFFAVTCLAPVFMIVTLIVAVRERRQLKWWFLWAVFIVIGIGAVRLNWTTGDLFISPFTVGLLGAGFVRSSDLSPWTIALYLPVGAGLFWIKRARRSDAST